MANKDRAKSPWSSRDYGMVSVSQGDGLAAIMADLGVDVVVDGGQTMNPSIDDIMQAIEKVPARTGVRVPQQFEYNHGRRPGRASIVTDKSVLRSCRRARCRRA